MLLLPLVTAAVLTLIAVGAQAGLTVQPTGDRKPTAATAGGEVRLALQPTGDWKPNVATAGGKVRLAVQPTEALKPNVATAGGKVRLSLQPTKALLQLEVEYDKTTEANQDLIFKRLVSTIGDSDLTFGRLCLKSSPVRLGTCVAPGRCRNSTVAGSWRCGMYVCCSKSELLPAGAPKPIPSPTFTFSAPFRQLVRNCGRLIQRRLTPLTRLLTPLTRSTTFGTNSLLDTKEHRRYRRSAAKTQSAAAPIAGRAAVAGKTLTLVNAVPTVKSPVINGQNVTGTVELPVGEWPWMALVGERGAGRPRWLCGGTLLSASTVLTAAHCVTGLATGRLVVRLGDYDIASLADGPHTTARVRRVVVHPAYRASQNDIALLLLTRSVAFSERVAPVCLPPAGAEPTGAASLAGWGRLSYGGRVASVLQEARLRVVDERRCERVYRQALAANFAKHFPDGFQGTKLCANGRHSDTSSRDACQGDSGGPLVAKGLFRPYQVIGVVSTGLGCGNPKYPGIYTKVSKYVQWILKNGK